MTSPLPLPLLQNFATDPVREPIVMSSAYIFDSPEEARARFAGENAGNVYTRFTNPNVETLESRLAALEGGEACVAYSTGMACFMALLMELTSPGGRVALSRGAFGSTTTLFKSYGRRWGLEILEFDPWDEEPLRGVDDDLQMIILESPTNPVLELPDIAAFRRRATELGALLVVDNTLSGPFGQAPLEHGADLVVHSLAKVIDGHGRAGGGAIVGPRLLIDQLKTFRRVCGSSLSPFNAWLLSGSLETLEMRSRHIGDAALQLVDALADSEHEVLHPWSPGFARRDLRERQLEIPPGVVSIRLGGNRDRAWQFLSELEVVGLGTNLGDGRSLATHPASTTHGKVPPAERVRAGITEDLVRISLGLEPPACVKDDVLRALEVVGVEVPA